MVERLKSRKFIGAAILITLATCVIFFTNINPDMFEKWSTYVFMVYSAYVLGNVGSKITTDKNNSK